MKKEVAVGTVIQYKQRSNDDHHPRWDRTRRAALLDQYHDLQAQGCSLRQAAKALHVPRSTLQAWRAYQESLDEHPAVVAFFHSSPGLAFLHRLVLGIHLVCTEVGACGIRLVCLLLQLTGLDRFVGGFLWDAAPGQPSGGGGDRGVSPRGKRAFGQRHARQSHHLGQG